MRKTTSNRRNAILPASDEPAKAEPARPHAFRVPSYRPPEVRRRKAQKVANVLRRLVQPSPGALALDVGCGGAYVADALRELGFTVLALDIADIRQTSNVDFMIGQAEALPFQSEAFSIVVTNQVIEHVADAGAHLREVSRVLAPGGIAYLATPNRFAVLEPHYRLPFLSWLPRGLANAYVKLLRRAEDYDVFPLTRSALLREAARAGLTCDDLIAWAIAETAAVEGSAVAGIASRLPDRVLRAFSGVTPTLVFALRKMEVDA